ncbi:MAG: F0F1 ATP synthase subunit B [Patescibacteria group bacterium]
MDALIETFHLDLKLIIAQIVNFLIVLGVLWQFALKPLQKIMNERTAKIDKSLQDAKAIEEKMTATDSERAAILKATKTEAAAFLEQARQEAEVNKQETAQKAKVEVEKIVQKGKEQLAADKTKLSAELKSEVADLVVAVTSKVLASALTKEVDKKVIEAALKEIK